MNAPDTVSVIQQLAPAATLDALRTGSTIRWWQTTTLLEVAGLDALTLLDGLCTQAVERIEPGMGVLGLFLDAKAKIIAPTLLHRLPDRDDAPLVMVETTPECLEPLRSHLTKYKLRAKVTITVSDMALIALIGDATTDVAAPDLGGAWTTSAHQARPTRTFVGSPQDCAMLVNETLPALGLGHADPEAVEADRIDHGVAGLHDLLPGRMPAEVGGMEHAVALDAGCYLGQEPVARLHYRGHANRTLRRLEADTPIVPPRPDTSGAEGPAQADLEELLALRLDGAAPDSRASGRLTTWARHADGRSVALGILRREVAEGAVIRLAETDSRLRATDSAPE